MTKTVINLISQCRWTHTRCCRLEHFHGDTSILIRWCINLFHPINPILYPSLPLFLFHSNSLLNHRPPPRKKRKNKKTKPISPRVIYLWNFFNPNLIVFCSQPNTCCLDESFWEISDFCFLWCQLRLSAQSEKRKENALGEEKTWWKYMMYLQYLVSLSRKYH